MRIGSQVSEIDGGLRPVAQLRYGQYSKFVDRVNAQRFKALVGKTSDDFPALGLPFAVERPHAARAHRELEEELKPAARRARHNRFADSSAYFPEFSAGSLFVA